MTYQSQVFFELPNNPAISTPGYTLVNARAGIEGPNNRWSIGGFAHNLTNKRYLLDAGNTGGGFGIPTYMAPVHYRDTDSGRLSQISCRTNFRGNRFMKGRKPHVSVITVLTPRTERF